jgi:hypothetical protein
MEEKAMMKYRIVTLAVVALLSVSFLACPMGGKAKKGGKAMEPREMKGREGTNHPGMDK